MRMRATYGAYRRRIAWDPTQIANLFFYDDTTRTAAWNSGNTDEELSALTVMGWVYPDSTSGYKGTLVGRGDGASQHWYSDQNNAELRGLENAAASYGVKSSAFTAATWRHFAHVYDSGGAGNSTRMLVYLDGVAVSMSSFSGTVPAALTTKPGKTWRVGSVSDGSGGYIFGASGKIAQVIVAGSVVSPADIQRAYDYTIGRK